MAKAEYLLSVLPLTSSDFPLTPASDNTLEFCMTKAIASNWKVREKLGVSEGVVSEKCVMTHAQDSDIVLAGNWSCLPQTAHISRVIMLDCGYGVRVGSCVTDGGLRDVDYVSRPRIVFSVEI